MINSIRKAYQWGQSMSLDVVLGAVAWHLAFLRFPEGNTTVSWETSGVLALCLWSIYVVDRILDTYRGQVDSVRHQFHQKYQFNLSISVLAALILAGCLAFFLPKPVIGWGLVWSGLVLLYFLFMHRWNRRSYGLKQWAIPFIYGGAILGTAWVQLPVITLSMWIIAAQWGLVLGQNLGLFRYYETSTEFSSTSRWIRWVGAGQLGVWILLFAGNTSYGAWISTLLASLSLIYALLPGISSVRPHFRGWVDGLLLAGWLAFLY